MTLSDAARHTASLGAPKVNRKDREKLFTGQAVFTALVDKDGAVSVGSQEGRKLPWIIEMPATALRRPPAVEFGLAHSMFAARLFAAESMFVLAFVRLFGACSS